MKIEEGVNLAGIQPEIVLALVIVEAVLLRYGQPLIITSIVDGEHMHGSLHYVGAAVDIRSVEWGPDGRLAAIAAALGPEYDVIQEHDHIHIEFQPKHGANPDAGSDNREPERTAPEISETHDRDERSGGEATLDSGGTGAGSDASGEPTD